MSNTLTETTENRTPEQDVRAYEHRFGQPLGCPFDNLENHLLDARRRLAQALALALLRFGVPSKALSLPAKVVLLEAQVLGLPAAPRQSFEEGLVRCRLAVEELERLTPFDDPDLGVIWLLDFIQLLDLLVAAASGLEEAVQELSVAMIIKRDLVRHTNWEPECPGSRKNPKIIKN